MLERIQDYSYPILNGLECLRLQKESHHLRIKLGGSKELRDRKTNELKLISYTHVIDAS